MADETKVAIYDIAEESGYSVFTVSSALNNNPRVKQSTKEKILSVAEKYGYQPLFSAQSLAVRKTNTMGVIIPELFHPFFGELVTHIEMEIHNSGYEMLLQVFELDVARERKCLKLLGQNKVDGLLYFTARCEIVRKYLQKSNKTNVPIIILGYPLDENISYVAVDRMGGMIKAVEHLVDLGHSFIGYAGTRPEGLCGGSKYDGYRIGLSKNGIDYNPEIDFLCESSLKTGYFLSKKIVKMSKRPTAIVAESDLIALGLMRGLRECGLDIPGDIALVGYDNIEVTEYAEVPLTTVAQPEKEMAQKGVEILIRLIQGIIDRPERILLEPELVIRRSTVDSDEPQL